jgi:hypothetical protein
MFDLEKAIREWKKGLQSDPALEEGFVAELEENLRKEVRAIARSAEMSKEEAFGRVAAEMRRPADVGAEFRKVYRSGRRQLPTRRAGFST